MGIVRHVVFLSLSLLSVLVAPIAPSQSVCPLCVQVGQDASRLVVIMMHEGLTTSRVLPAPVEVSGEDMPCGATMALALLLSSEYGMCKTVKARFWPRR